MTLHEIYGVLGGACCGALFQSGPIWWRLARVVLLITGVNLLIASAGI